MTLSKKIIFIGIVVLGLFVGAILVLAIPPEVKWDISFTSEPSLSGVCFTDEITNLQDSNDDFPYKAVLNDTTIDLSKVTVDFYEEKFRDVQIIDYTTHCEPYSTESANGTVVQYPNCTQFVAGSHTEQEPFWLERGLIDRTEDGSALRNQWEEVQIKKGETKRFRRCYNFNEIPEHPDGGWGSIGYTYLEIKGEEFFDFEHSSWWDTNFGFRYEDRTNVTSMPNVHAVNNNNTIGNDSTIWVKNATAGEEIFLYCSVSDCATGSVAMANHTDEVPWEMDNMTGYLPFTLWSDPEMLWVYHLDTLNDSTSFNWDCNFVGTHTLATGIYGNGTTFAADTDTSGCPVDDMAQANQYTLTFWAYITAANNGQYIYKNENEGIICGVDGGGKWYCGQFDGDWNAFGTTAVTVDTWTFIGLTWDGSDVRIYINGDLTQTIGAGNHISFGANRFRFKAIRGTVDEVRMYNGTARTTEQIRQEYYNVINISSLGAEETAPILIDSQVTLFLNGTQANRTYEVGETANFSTTTNITGITIFMDSNYTGWELQSGTTTYDNSTYLDTIGDNFNLTGYVEGNATVNPSSQTFFFNVTIPTMPPEIEYGIIVTFITEKFKTIMVR